MKLTWYGHSAFRLEAGAAKILIDPFLSDNPSWDGHSAFTQGTIWHIDSSDRGRRAVAAARATHHPRARWRDGAGALRRHLDELRHT
jgi:L-ascorbate metabolism protein UlaG (beta-lactamase superfamily)